MIDIGTICTKIAGRDAGSKCVVVDRIDDSIVLIDGQTRRRKCNIKHLEPEDSKLEIKKGASHIEIIKAFEKLNIKVKTTKPKPKKERPIKIRKSLLKPKKEQKVKKKEIKVAKKEEPKVEKKAVKKVTKKVTKKVAKKK